MSRQRHADFVPVCFRQTRIPQFRREANAQLALGPGIPDSRANSHGPTHPTMQLPF